ncbi:hypothetical protein D5086_025055 [Populus alba]|uniref:Uncharacterized protein n=1 Tax=Populus alba TaxID=43335 RepID=A0ACC4B7Q3_POPAL
MALLDQSFFHYSLLAYYLLGPPTFIALRFFQFPYGKHNRLGWGPTIPPPLAWFIMESPSILLPLILFPFGQHFTNPKALVLMSPYLLHYFHRTFIYPLRIYQSTSHQNTKTTIGFPLILTFNGFLTQALNTYIQARWVSHYKSDYDSDGDGKDAKDGNNGKDAKDVKGEKDGKSENEGKDAKNGKPPTQIAAAAAAAAAAADENKPPSPSKDIAMSSSLDSSKLDVLVAEIEPATARDGNR